MSLEHSGAEALDRRAFLLRVALGVAPIGSFQGVQDSLTGGGATGTLRDPAAAGRSRRPTDPKENDAAIQAIEQRLACSCGCTLDIFTCRTTDFTCTYSPELHREVLALWDDGKTAREILDTFVSKYGEKALMAPKPQGFNLWGYLLPGAAITAAGVALVAVLRRRESVAAESRPTEQPAAHPVSATPEELERLRRALAEVED
ncbi:MAG TPA: cytochrome c-type biogenesis protein CcmH [Gemmatimonadales bacterium]|nr:cytochrome c-type biogenesis protein CcmH [Gemmatimonadales bacterium]